MQLSDKQIDFISKEIEVVYSQIDKQRESTTNFLKIYLSIIVGLLSYIYFLENRLVTNGQRTSLPNDEFMIFGEFGILVCLISFLIGWALLDNVTKTVYKSIKYYKHISYLRHIIANTFPDDTFRKNSIMPIKQDKIPMRISKQVPIIGGLINFALLVLNFYFLRLFLPSDIANATCCIILSAVSLFYANQLEKHFEEILIADTLLPQADENEIKKTIKRLVRLQKNKKNYKITKALYVVTLLSVVAATSLLVINYYHNITPYGHILILLPGLLFLISVIPRIYMGLHRLKNIQCFE